MLEGKEKKGRQGLINPVTYLPYLKVHYTYMNEMEGFGITMNARRSGVNGRVLGTVADMIMKMMKMMMMMIR